MESVVNRSGRSANNSLLGMEIEGGRELEAALAALGQDRLIKATMKRALLAAAKPAVATAQRLAPKAPGSGRMATKIAATTTLARRQRRGGRYKSDPNVAHVFLGAAPRGPAVLQEFGTGPRYQKKTKRFTGATPASPFMRPAWEQHKMQILRDFSAQLWDQIERSAKRLAKRSLKAARG